MTFSNMMFPQPTHKALREKLSLLVYHKYITQTLIADFFIEKTMEKLNGWKYSKNSVNI